MTEQQLRQAKLSAWGDGLFCGFLFGFVSGAIITLAALWPKVQGALLR